MSRTRDSTALLRRLAGRLRALTPFEALGTMILLALSQGLLLLAFILPLKIVLLVTQPELPDYLTGWVAPEDRVPFIIGLAVASIFSYGLHHLCQWGANQAADRGSRRIAASHDKLRVFADAEALMRDSYYRLGRIGASALLAASAFALLLWLDPLLFLVLAVLVAMEALVVTQLARSSSPVGLATGRLIEEKLGFVAGILGSVNFLLGFVVLVAAYLHGGEGHPLIAIVTLLLARESQQKLAMLMQDAHFLDRREARLRPLYFATDLAPGPEARLTDRETALAFAPTERIDWLRATLEEVLSVENSCVKGHHWVDSVTPGVLWLRAEIDAEAGRRTLWVKWFEHGSLVMAEHEAELLTRHPIRNHGLPGWLGQTRVAGHRVYLLPWPGKQLPAEHDWRKQRLTRMALLWAMRPDASLARRYRHTHRLIWERLPVERLQELAPVLESVTDRRKAEKLAESWPALLERVRKQPLALHNPAMAMRGNWRDDDVPVCLRWDQWVIEPVGHDPVLAEYRPEEIRHTLAQTPWPNDTPLPAPGVVYHVGLLSAFEKALNQRHLVRAKKVIFRILEEVPTGNPAEDVRTSGGADLTRSPEEAPAQDHS